MLIRPGFARPGFVQARAQLQCAARDFTCACFPTLRAELVLNDSSGNLMMASLLENLLYGLIPMDVIHGGDFKKLDKAANPEDQVRYRQILDALAEEPPATPSAGSAHPVPSAVPSADGSSADTSANGSASAETRSK